MFRSLDTVSSGCKQANKLLIVLSSPVIMKNPHRQSYYRYAWSAWHARGCDPQVYPGAWQDPHSSEKLLPGWWHWGLVHNPLVFGVTSSARKCRVSSQDIQWCRLWALLPCWLAGIHLQRVWSWSGLMSSGSSLDEKSCLLTHSLGIHFPLGGWWCGLWWRFLTSRGGELGLLGIQHWTSLG